MASPQEELTLGSIYASIEKYEAEWGPSYFSSEGIFYPAEPGTFADTNKVWIIPGRTQGEVQVFTRDATGLVSNTYATTETQIRNFIRSKLRTA